MCMNVVYSLQVDSGDKRLAEHRVRADATHRWHHADAHPGHGSAFSKLLHRHLPQHVCFRVLRVC